MNTKKAMIRIDNFSKKKNVEKEMNRPGQGFWVYGILGVFLLRYSVFFCQNVPGIKYFSPKFLVFCIMAGNTVGVFFF